MAAHTFAPEDALPPPKSAVIYSRDGRKRSLNIDMTKHFAPAPHDHSIASPTPTNSTTIGTASTVDGSTGAINDVRGSASSGSNDQGGLTTSTSTSSSHKKKKKKKSKKKLLDRIEETNSKASKDVINSATTRVMHRQAHHLGCQHEHGHRHHHNSGHHHHHEEEDDEDEDFYSDEDAYDPETPALASSACLDSTEGHSHSVSSMSAPLRQGTTISNSAESSSAKKKKKKRKKSSTGTMPSINIQHSHNSHGNNGSNSKSMVPTSHRNGHERSTTKHVHDGGHTQNDGFWHYSDAEERQRIREFWFQLREEERRSLVRVEKEAVLKKMKEQQRHSCSCSLCGRKRTAIEEELELLYDAYYDELEQYANQQQPSDGHALTYAQHSPVFEDDDLSDESRGSDEEEEDEEEDDEDDEDGYEDEEEEEDYEDEVSTRKAPFSYRSGFPNTLQAKGNILTVAEDLLENDGKKFLEMMDRLADRKVQRDDELMDNRGVYEEFDDDEDGDFEDDGVEEDALTKEQRMEEGRRMFQAFAARMFEQRVLSAYREKVAQERQERLLAELEEESRQEQLREERKEREKERKRDKKRLQRQQKEEERAAKEALRLAEEKRLLEERERKLEADRKRREEERRAKEEEKRLREEERLKKEEERKRKIKEEKAREIEKERKRKEEQHAKEQEELVRKAELEAQKVAEEAVKEAKRLEQEVYLKQQLAEEQKRQQELRQKEQKVKEDLEKLEWETASAAAAGKEVAVTEEIVAAVLENSSHDLAPESITTSISLNRDGTTVSRSGIASVTHGSQSRSPTMPLSTSPLHAEESLINQSQPAQGPSTSLANSLWSNPYSAQSISQPQLQPMFASTMQQGLFRPPGHFGPISGDLDPFSSRMGYTTGRGGYMGASHQNASTFQSEPQHHLSSNQLPQQMGGLRSPGLNSIGFGQINVPSKQLLTLMNPNSAPGSHELTNSNGSPLHSPPALGAIGTPIGSFGPISPIGHTRRTSTPYGTSSGDVIKPIQRPVPIGRPKDSQTHSHMSSSFDGISLGLSGLTIGSELDRRPRSPSLNLAGGSALDLDGIALGKDALRPTGDGADHPSLHAFGNENGSIQTLSSSDRNQRESSFFSNSFFGSRMNGHDPFLASDFSSFGHQLQSHGSLPNASHFMPPYSMHIPTSPHNQQQHLQHQQQLFMQQQFMHPNLQDLQPQQLGLSPPPLNGSNTWSRTNFMRPPHMNGPGGTVVNSSGNGSSSNIGLMSSTSRAHSPPPVLGGSLHNGSGGAGGLHSPLLPIGPPNGPSSHLQQQQQQQQHQYGHFPSNGANGSLGLTVGSGRKSVSHLPPLRHGSLSSDASSNNSSGSANSNSTGLVMENDRLSNGFRGAGAGYTSHHIQQ